MIRLTELAMSLILSMIILVYFDFVGFDCKNKLYDKHQLINQDIKLEKDENINPNRTISSHISYAWDNSCDAALAKSIENQTRSDICDDLKYFSEGDDMKSYCDSKHFYDEDCIILSIGSNGQYKFESDVTIDK